MSATDTNIVVDRPEEEKYENLGGIYFPILQQEGNRVMTKIGDGRDRSQIIFLGYLRQHDRQVRPNGQ